MITIVDYGLGNIRAFVNIYRRLNIPVEVARTAEELAGAARIILPGVGAFDWAMAKLDASGMRDTLDELVLGQRKPVLGICVGMQMMTKGSEEGVLPGLGWLDAEVRRFEAGLGSNRQPRLPHMGWNDVSPVSRACLFRGLEDVRCYFLHSYYLQPLAPELGLATTDYHGGFVSAVRNDNIFGTQFHPEKSHDWGIGLLRNFGTQ